MKRRQKTLDKPRLVWEEFKRKGLIRTVQETNQKGREFSDKTIGRTMRFMVEKVQKPVDLLKPMGWEGLRIANQKRQEFFIKTLKSQQKLTNRLRKPMDEFPKKGLIRTLQEMNQKKREISEKALAQSQRIFTDTIRKPLEKLKKKGWKETLQEIDQKSKKTQKKGKENLKTRLSRLKSKIFRKVQEKPYHPVGVVAESLEIVKEEAFSAAEDAIEESVETWIENPAMKLVLTLSPVFDTIREEIEELRAKNPQMSFDELADRYGTTLCWKYSGIGAISSIPSIIPGMGTLIQMATEGGIVTTDLAFMLRWMGAMTAGIAMIYEQDIETRFHQDFVIILGIWCGVIQPVAESSKGVGAKIVVNQVRNISKEALKKMNRRVGTGIVTRFSAKRGTAAIGKMIPFGVGAYVGGQFNYTTMKKFKEAAVEFYSASKDTELILKEEAGSVSGVIESPETN